MPEQLRTEDFNYQLPEELIASKPTEKRDGSRMMVIDRTTGSISCHMFDDFLDFIKDDDLCIFNNTKVVKSRFISDDQKIEITRLDETEPNVWKCLVKPGKKMRLGHSIIIDGIEGVVEDILEDGERLIRFEEAINIEKKGKLALPHYMGREAEEFDSDRYQTVYAQKPGAIAAPTAGLHFTETHLSKFLIPLSLYMLALERSGPSKQTSFPIMICIVNFMKFPKKLQIRSMMPEEKYLLEQQSLES